MNDDPSTIVSALLAAAELTPSPTEWTQLVTEYADLQTELAMLNALVDARYEQPAAVFRASL